MIRILLVAMALAACSSATQEAGGPEIAVLGVPEVLQTCPKGTDAPSPPSPPRTVEQVVEWARGVSAAQSRTEKARAECAYRLRKLNEWVAANQVVPGNVSLTNGDAP